MADHDSVAFVVKIDDETRAELARIQREQALRLRIAKLDLAASILQAIGCISFLSAILAALSR